MLFLIILLSLSSSSLAMQPAPEHLYIGTDSDGYAGPRAAWPLKDQYCQCDSINYPNGKAFNPLSWNMESVFKRETLLSRRYLGTKHGAIPDSTHNKTLYYVDHYKVTTLEKGLLRNTYREYVHLHRQHFSFDAKQHITQPEPIGKWFPHKGATYNSSGCGPLYTCEPHKKWTTNTRLANALIVGGAVIALAYLARNYKRIEPSAQEINSKENKAASTSSESNSLANVEPKSILNSEPCQNSSKQQ